LTAKFCPPIEREPDLAGPALAETVKLAIPFPAPLTAVEIHEGLLLDAVQAHALSDDVTLKP
jgi:hypothetical protein